MLLTIALLSFFQDQEVHKVIALNAESNAYYVYLENDMVKEKKLEKEVLTMPA